MLRRLFRGRRTALALAVVLALALPAAAWAASAAPSAAQPAAAWAAFDRLAERLWSGLAAFWSDRAARCPNITEGSWPDRSGQTATKAGRSADPYGQPGSNQAGPSPSADGSSETDEGPSADPSG